MSALQPDPAPSPHGVVERRPASPANWATLADAWQELAQARPIGHFVSAPWIETWLEVYGRDLGTEIWTMRDAGRLTGAMLGTIKTERRGPVPIRCLYLQSAGEASGEGVRAEYNALLTSDDARDETLRAFARALIDSGADEVIAEGFDEPAHAALAAALPGWLEDTMWSEDRWVDLAEVRSSGVEYRHHCLSKNTRGQANRTLNAFAKLGAVETEVAATVERALAIYDELVDLHQASWQARGGPGAFASERFRRFHAAYIQRTFASGGVQLIRVSAGEETIGALYNFVDRGRILFYQSGLSYRDDNRYRPGIAAHVSAIERCLELGFDAYHFLAGDEHTPRYKTSLSNRSTRLAWATFRRPGLKTRAIDGLRAIKRRLRSTA